MRRFLFENDSNESAESSARKRPGRRTILAWLWVVCWGATIWTLGGDSFSFSETSETLLPWLDWLTGDLDWRTRYQIYVAIRKSAHFVEYAILALLTFRAAMLSAARRTQIATAGWVALFIVMALATADEARQAFSPVRTGSPYDILIDVAGGLIAVIALLMISRRMRAHAPVESSA
jgi:VanZ family protein